MYSEKKSTPSFQRYLQKENSFLGYCLRGIRLERTFHRLTELAVTLLIERFSASSVDA